MLNTSFDLFRSTQYAVNAVSVMYFSIAVFLGLNLICFILESYLEVSRSISKISAEAGRARSMKDQLKTTTKVMAIVATDFMF